MWLCGPWVVQSGSGWIGWDKQQKDLIGLGEIKRKKEKKKVQQTAAVQLSVIRPLWRRKPSCHQTVLHPATVFAHPSRAVSKQRRTHAVYQLYSLLPTGHLTQTNYFVLEQVPT